MDTPPPPPPSEKNAAKKMNKKESIYVQYRYLQSSTGPIQSSSTQEYIIPIDFFPSLLAVYSININKAKDRECNNVDSATVSRPER